MKKMKWESIFIWGILLLIGYQLYQALVTPPATTTGSPQSTTPGNVVPNLTALLTNDASTLASFLGM